MPNQPPASQSRLELEDEYRVWCRLCEDKHGLPWPVPEEDINATPDHKLLSEIKKLKVLGRTPHEG
jgi:hypothetical protein